MLVAEALTYRHNGQDRVYRFDFQARPGEVTTVSGPSGAGKSTLLDLVAGFLPAASGRLCLGELDLLPLPPEQRPASILFQSETLFEHLSAGANVALGLGRGIARAQASKAIAAALAEVGLPDIGNQRAATLSGGQKQRVALARTLLRDRPVLLLDEPFSALDDETRSAVRQLVRKLTEERGWHTILVSHHADDLHALASRAYRLEAGSLRLL